MTRKDGGDSRKNLVHAGVGCYSNIVTEGIGIIANILFQRLYQEKQNGLKHHVSN